MDDCPSLDENTYLITSSSTPARLSNYGSTPSLAFKGKRYKMADEYGPQKETRTSHEKTHHTTQHSPSSNPSTYRVLTKDSVYIPPKSRSLYENLSLLFRHVLQFNYRRESPHSNVIHTTKYTLLTFIPKNLFEQFHRVANLYFLLIIILNFIPAIEAFGKEISWIPLACVLLVTAVKDAIEDIRRYRSDRHFNAKRCTVFNRFVTLLF